MIYNIRTIAISKTNKSNLIQMFRFVLVNSSVTDRGGGRRSVAGGVCYLRGLRAATATDMVRHSFRLPNGVRSPLGRLVPAHGSAQLGLAADHR